MRLLVRSIALVCALGVSTQGWALPKQPEAAKLLEEGQVKYKAENFDGAIEDFKNGYEIEADPAFLIAWAQAERQRGRCRAAVRLYQRFLATDPPEVAQEFARDGIVRCADQLAADQPLPDADEPLATDPDGDPPTDDPPSGVEPDEAEQAPKPDKRNRWYRDPLGTSLVAVGVAGAGVGAGLLIGAQVEFNRGSGDYGEFDERVDRIDNLRIAGGAVLGVGAAILIGGVIRWVVVGTRKNDGPANVGFILDRNRAGLTITGRF